MSVSGASAPSAARSTTSSKFGRDLGDDELDGGAGNDTLDGGSNDDELTDTDGTNVLIGGSGADSITISGVGAVHDKLGNVLCGGTGVDTLSAASAITRECGCS